MASNSMKKLFALVAVVVAILVAGCDQVTRLFGGGRQVVRREPATPKPSRPEAETTPRPMKSGSVIFPDPVDPTPAGAYATAPPASRVTPTPAPGLSPGATVSPWLTAQLADAGNGLKKLEITGSGGFGRNDRTDIFTMGGLDGEVYLLVYRWSMSFLGGPQICDVLPDVYIGGSEAGVFKIRSIEDRRVVFDYVGRPPGVEKYALHAGWEVQKWCGGSGSVQGKVYSPYYKQRVIESLRSVMPATESLDVVSLPASDSATASARLGDQAAARWGGEWLSFAGLPLYPLGDKYPRQLVGWIDMGVIEPSRPRWEQIAGIQVDHGVGSKSAFAFRWEYWRFAPKFCPIEIKNGYVYVDCWTTYEALKADFNPLWRMNKGEATWKSLQVFPRKQSTLFTPGIELETENRWNQVLWSDLHKRWFFWIGAATGSVYVVDETDAASLP